MSARIVENGFKTLKLWLKQGDKGLFVKVLKQQGPTCKEKDCFGKILKLARTTG